jgi:hypothetical protein
MQWSKERQTDKSRQYNGLKKIKQAKVDNTMVKRKTNRQRSTIQWSKEKQTDI